MAQNVIRDELRRRAIVAKLAAGGSTEPALQWLADRTAQAVNFTICRKDDLPGSGDFPASDARDVGVVPLPGLLPFLFADQTAPAAPATPVLATAPGTSHPDLVIRDGAGSRRLRSFPVADAGRAIREGHGIPARPAGLHRPLGASRRAVLLRRARRRQLGERERSVGRGLAAGAGAVEPDRQRRR